jgi:hypothetical protein
VAGDWIKVEHATANKPEVTRAAEMLGISRREALGLFFDFWIWLDNNLSGSCPAVVRNVSRKSLDEFLHCPGFAAVLESIGWGEFDDKAWELRVSNAERHNGNTAKSRALDSKRKSDKRREMSGSEPDKSRTREEKRREEITPKSKALVRNKPRTTHTLESPTEEHEAIAAKRGVSCQAEFQKYRDWMAATGKRHRDEIAGFRNWLRNAKADTGELAARKLAAARNIDILTGKVRHDGPIDGVAERVDRAPVFALPGGLREPGADDVEGLGPGPGARAVGG